MKFRVICILVATLTGYPGFAAADAGLSLSYIGGCMLRPDKRVGCWGSPTMFSSRPDVEYTQISVGPFASCGIRDDQTLECWGTDHWAEVVELTSPPPGTFAAVSVGTEHACALSTEGIVHCWGSAFWDLNLPPKEPQIFLASGDTNSCALNATGIAQCWGNEEYLVTSPPGDSFLEISVASYFACGIVKGSGSLKCWGSLEEEIPDDTGPYTKLAVTGAGVCALTETGEVECFGRNLWGELTPDRTVGESPQFDQITCNGATCCAQNVPDSRPFCWGEGLTGTLPFPGSNFVVDVARWEALHGNISGDWGCVYGGEQPLQCWGSFPIRNLPVQFDAVWIGAVSVGSEFACGIDGLNGGAAVCWGDESSIVGATTGSYSRVSTGKSHACGLTFQTAVKCWGSNVSGQAGAVAGTYLDVSAGGAHSCGVRTDGTLNCWGNNLFNQTVEPGGKFSRVSSGSNHSCALREDQTIECWGRNENQESDEPEGQFDLVVAGDEQSCALDAQGKLFCWGQEARSAPLDFTFASISVGSEGRGCGGLTGTERGIVCWDGDALTHVATSAMFDHCGDDVLNDTEECDDGNRIADDGCTDDCRICGDTIRDGKILVSDALQTLFRAIGHNVQCPLWLCDVNLSEDVTATDALIVLRIAVGLPVSIKCGRPETLVLKLDSASEIVGLQLAISYGEIPIEIGGEQENALCTTTFPADLTVYNDSDAPDRRLEAAFTRVQGIVGPRELARCVVRSYGRIRAREIEVEVLDARNSANQPVPNVQVVAVFE